jgi:hypothetical protein
VNKWHLGQALLRREARDSVAISFENGFGCNIWWRSPKFGIGNAMGRLEQFAQQTFAEETERITGGAAEWKDPPELRLQRVTSDGGLVLRRSRRLEHLAAPWSQAPPRGEVMVELKLDGNHLDRRAVERATLRRQVRLVQWIEEHDLRWRGDIPLWLVAPHLPPWLKELRRPVPFAPGCYWVDPEVRSFLWVAANELPLLDELVPFLLARSGQALDDFCRWVTPRRPLEWVLNMLKHLPMTLPTRDELLQRMGPEDDPEIEARRQYIVKFLLNQDPNLRQQLIDTGIAQGRQEGRVEGRLEGRVEGQLNATRAFLRQQLSHRKLAPTKNEEARIDACTDLATLERWLERAVTAVRVLDVLE